MEQAERAGPSREGRGLQREQEEGLRGSQDCRAQRWKGIP